jgi:hypothetical protein
MLGLAGSALPERAPDSVSGIGSVREGRRRFCASAELMATRKASRASPSTARFSPPRSAIAEATIPPLPAAYL